MLETIRPQIASSGNNVYVAGNDGTEDNSDILFQEVQMMELALAMQLT